MLRAQTTFKLVVTKIEAQSDLDQTFFGINTSQVAYFLLCHIKGT